MSELSAGHQQKSVGHVRHVRHISRSLISVTWNTLAVWEGPIELLLAKVNNVSGRIGISHSELDVGCTSMAETNSLIFI